ncbi:MAG: zinc ribbon domain-containing protein [Candidatus Aminicenantes bacterium]|nr:zinc ribbon domain-containing protein [Candidatus Aminicenantes bacterium]
MPLYEYKCRDCGRVTEVLVRSASSGEEPLCAHCRGRNMDKLISSPGAVMTGSPSPKGTTCCGRDERCGAPPCSSTGTCRRD